MKGDAFHMEEEEKKEPIYSPVLPFDPSMYDSFVTYDNMPYTCNRDMCRNAIAMHSGNIVKYFSYQMDETKVAVSIS